MSNKRFRLTNPKNAFQEMKCGINDGNKTLTFNEVVDVLNILHEENQRLRNDNLTLFALLGDIRALLRTGDVTECIEKINRLEKEMQQ